MRTTRLVLAGLVLATLPSLHGCLPLVAGAAVGTGALIADDRRSSGTYVDDQGIELKAGNRIADGLSGKAHVNVTSFNRVVLLTGEAPDEVTRNEVARIVQGVPGVKQVQNEIVIGPNSSFADRSSDAATTANVKARFVQNAQGRFQATHVKVVTEAGTVFLMGIVRRSEADAATAIAAGSSGAKKVVEVFEYID